MVKLPKYTKPYHAFAKQVKIGDDVILTKRIQTSTGWVFRDIEGRVIDKNMNGLKVHSEKLFTPWYTIHNWEIFRGE